MGMKLESSQEIRAAIEARLSARGYAFLDRMLRQTMVPQGATVLRNNHGTAPGLYFPSVSHPSSASPHIFLLPGPPRELQPMFRDSVLPILQEIAQNLDSRECRTYRVVGLGESAVEQMVGLQLSSNPEIEVGYCARPNEVDFRLIARSEILDAVEPLVITALGKHLVSSNGEGIEASIVATLTARHLSLSTAESCTGGLLASRITDTPGASRVFHQGFVTYSNNAKIDLLGVDPALVKEFGAVSEPVARAMAEGARDKAASTFALSLTGIAGPDGGSPGKPVGLVFMALARDGKETLCREARFPTDRLTFKQLATQAALDMLRLELL
jgi:nicotinamide-nucleotide amidase